MNSQALVEGLTKFQEWAKEYALVAAETETDAADELMLALYKDTKRTEKLLGGSNAPILMDAAKRIKSLREATGQLNTVREELANAIYLNRRNCGGHYYPGIAPLGEMFTSNCDYCKCWMGPSRSGGPEGIDQFGDCPENSKLRDAYKLLKDRSDDTETAGNLQS